MSLRLDRIQPSWFVHSTTSRRPFWSDYPFLLIVALSADMLFPFLIWKHVLPSSVRWISDIMVALLLLLTIMRMMANNRIPGAIFVVVALSLIGITVANFEGQAWQATAWGWWSMFRYPLLGVYAYLQTKWPKNFARRLVQFCVWGLTFELIVQLGQFATGEVPGDDLAGSFGRHGVGELVTFTALVLAVAWGKWLADGDWKTAFYITTIGLFSSVLAENKFYIVAMLTIVVFAVFLHSWRTGRLYDFFIYPAIIAILLFIFGVTYNLLVADVRHTRRIEDFLQWQNTETKLNYLEYDPNVGIYRFGRGFAVAYGLQSIQRDWVTVLFGMGIGSRSESVSLGIMGVGFLRDGYGLTSSPSSLLFIQELGLGGIAMLSLFFLWLTWRLLRLANRRPATALNTVAYGLAMFTLLWPLWIFNQDVWTYGVPQMLYWTSVGFVFAQEARLPVPSELMLERRSPST